MDLQSEISCKKCKVCNIMIFSLFLLLIAMNMQPIRCQYEYRYEEYESSDECDDDQFIMTAIRTCYATHDIVPASAAQSANPLIYNPEAVCLNIDPYIQSIECVFKKIGYCANTDKNYPTIEGYRAMYRDLCLRRNELDLKCIGKQENVDVFRECGDTMIGLAEKQNPEHEDVWDSQLELVCILRADLIEECSTVYLGCDCNTSSTYMKAYVEHGTPRDCPPFKDLIDVINYCGSNGTNEDRVQSKSSFIHVRSKRSLVLQSACLFLVTTLVVAEMSQLAT